MKKNIILPLLSILFLLILVSSDFAQETDAQFNSESATAPVIGKIYRKTQADSLYGPVLFSYEIPTEQLKGMLNKTYKYIMFKFDKDKFLITDNKRNVMNFSNAAVSADETLKVYSVSKVQELIKLGLGPVTKIEKRANVTSITNEAYTLEFASGCPPFCD
jgi:hypothetical protein